MKKMYKYILIITLMMFGFIGEVRAELDKTGINNCVADGTCNHVCKYKVKSNGDVLNLYTGTHESYPGYTYFFSVGNEGLTRLVSGLIDTDKAHVSAKVKFPENCPKNVYWEDVYGESKYCFDNGGDDNYCKSNTFNHYSYKIGSFGNQTYTFDGKPIVMESKENVSEKRNEDIGLDISNGVVLDKCVEDGTCMPICYYDAIKTGDYSVIYYFKNKPVNESYAINTSWDNGLLYLNFSKHISTYNKIKKGQCPTNLYHSESKNKTCFDNNDDNCVKEDLIGTTVSEIDGEAKKKYLESVKETDAKVPKCDTIKEEIISKGVEENKIKEICGFIKVDGDSTVPKYFYMINLGNRFSFYYKNNETDGLIETSDVENITFKQVPSCGYFEKIYYGSTRLPYQSSKYRWDSKPVGISDNDDKVFYNYCYPENTSSGNQYIDVGIIDSCQSLIGTELVEEISSWMLYVKIAVPIIIIVMGSLDFGKAFISSDEDAMKKAQKRFIMRLIIGMVIFFIPTVIKIFLNIANQVWAEVLNDTCGITF